MNLPHLYTESMWDDEARRRRRAIAAEYYEWMRGGTTVHRPSSIKYYVSPCSICNGICNGHAFLPPPIEQINREAVANVEATAWLTTPMWSVKWKMYSGGVLISESQGDKTPMTPSDITYIMGLVRGEIAAAVKRINDCSKCGRVFSDSYCYVECTCGNKTDMFETQDAADAAWNAANPIAPPAPRRFPSGTRFRHKKSAASAAIIWDGEACDQNWRMFIPISEKFKVIPPNPILAEIFGDDAGNWTPIDEEPAT